MEEYLNSNLILDDDGKLVIFNVPSSRIFTVKSKDNLKDTLEKINAKCADNEIVKKRPPEDIKYKQMIISCAEECNLQCKYCFADKGHYNQDEHRIMEYEDYVKLLDFIKTLDYGLGSICLFGGEPLLGFKSIKIFIADLKEYYEEKGYDMPKLGIVTNGTLITREIADFFDEYNFIVSISIDGDKKNNDLNRIFKYSNDSVYDTIVKNMKLLRKRSFILTASATISRYTILNYKPGDYQNTVKELRDMGFDIAECFLADENYEITEREKRNIEAFAKDQVDYLFEKVSAGVELENIPRIPLGILSSIIKKEYANECPAGKYLFYYTSKGDFYPCQMYFAAKRKTSKLVSRSENKYCKDCFLVNICSGYCPGSSVLANGDENTILERRCIFHKALVKECILKLNRYMNDEMHTLAEIKRFCKNMVEVSKKYSL